MKKPSLLALAILLTAGTAQAQEAFPARTITLVVPQGAGGASDIMARVLAQRMSLLLKQSIIVDNRVGAGGNIGISYVAKARPDGYTLLVNGNSHAINPALYKNAGFDPAKDFIPVAKIAEGSLVVVAHAAFPAKDIAQLIAAGKASPGKIFYSSPGNGSLNQLATAMFEQAAGVSFSHVPYKSAPASLSDVASGQVAFTFSALASALPFVANGRLHAIAVTNTKRVAALPDVPSISETLPAYGVTPWYGLFAPAGTPAAIVDALHSAANVALKDSELMATYAKQGLVATPETRNAFSALVQAEIPAWQKIVKESGATVD
jgi:tripartite-type tricarboxylate transporter receptor subunit TctC